MPRAGEASCHQPVPRPVLPLREDLALGSGRSITQGRAPERPHGGSLKGDGARADGGSWRRPMGMAFKGVGLRCAPRRGRTSFGAGGPGMQQSCPASPGAAREEGQPLGPPAPGPTGGRAVGQGEHNPTWAPPRGRPPPSAAGTPGLDALPTAGGSQPPLLHQRRTDQVLLPRGHQGKLPSHLPSAAKGCWQSWGLLSHLKALPPRPLPQPARDSLRGSQNIPSLRSQSAPSDELLGSRISLRPQAGLEPTAWAALSLVPGVVPGISAPRWRRAHSSALDCGQRGAHEHGPLLSPLPWGAIPATRRPHPRISRTLRSSRRWAPRGSAYVLPHDICDIVQVLQSPRGGAALQEAQTHELCAGRQEEGAEGPVRDPRRGKRPMANPKTRANARWFAS